MRVALLVLALPLIAGCSAIARENGDYFEAGPDIARFEADDQACGSQARDHTSYDLTAMQGTPYDQNRAYNGVYERCMRGRGYRPRPYFRNWLPEG
jgi:hypothetical protein